MGNTALNVGNEVGTQPSTKREGTAGPKAWLELDDRRLLDACAVDVYRASGPGGQKRNKTSSAVRLRHGPSGLIVTATESRSQSENRQRALKRLREAIALTQRNRVRLDAPAPAFLTESLEREPDLGVGRRHPDYLRIVQHVLDVLLAAEASVGDAARALGVSTARLVRFLRRDANLWEHANRMRKELGLPVLR